MNDKITGVMTVKDQSYTVRMALKSTKHICDEYIIADNESTDKTYDVIQKAISDFDLNADLKQISGPANEVFLQLYNEAEGYKLKIEGDQIFFKDRLETTYKMIKPYTTMGSLSIILQHKLNLQLKTRQTNSIHYIIYGPGIKMIIQPGHFWPKPGNGRKYEIRNPPISVNAGIHKPLYRLKRWHRSHGSFVCSNTERKGTWWNRYKEGDYIPEYMKLEDYDPPYQDHMTMMEYMELLWERDKGARQFGGENLKEAAENYVKQNIEEYCTEYNGIYPEVLQKYINEHGFDMPKSDERLIT